MVFTLYVVLVIYAGGNNGGVSSQFIEREFKRKEDCENVLRKFNENKHTAFGLCQEVKK